MKRTPSRHHELAMDGLEPGENHYRVLLYNAGIQAAPSIDSGDELVTTPPTMDEPVRFAVYGDAREGHATHARVMEAIAAAGVDFVTSTGDIVARGHDEGDWQKYFELARTRLRGIPAYPGIGDHEIGSGAVGILRFRELFAKVDPPDPLGAWYSFDVGAVHMVMIDSNKYDSPLQLAWLAKDLAAARARGARAIFAVTHHGPISRAMHGGSSVALAQYVPVLQKYQVQVMFSGHDHAYERGLIGKLQYVVSGGGGADLYRARCGRPGFKRCRDKALSFASENHYVLVEVNRDDFRMCTYRLDGTTIEPCVTTALPRARKSR